MRALVALALSLLAVPAAAQDAATPRDRTLADIRQQLAVVQVELRELSRELATTGAPALGIEGTTFPDRLIGLEAQVEALSDATERLAFHVESVARDGGTRLEDLRFQLCELTPDCDLAALPAPSPLGGEAADAGATPTPTGPVTGPVTGSVTGSVEGFADSPADAPALAVGEAAALDAVRADLAEGRAEEAVRGARAFLDAYPSGPLSAEARLVLADALVAQDDAQGAARAYLDAFTGAPDGPVAPQALVGLGRSLHALGSVEEGCLALDEVALRFPDAPEVTEAAQARAELGCF